MIDGDGVSIFTPKIKTEKAGNGTLIRNYLGAKQQLHLAVAL